jgi:hypothetical protein
VYTYWLLFGETELFEHILRMLSFVEDEKEKMDASAICSCIPARSDADPATVTGLELYYVKITFVVLLNRFCSSKLRKPRGRPSIH